MSNVLNQLQTLSFEDARNTAAYVGMTADIVAGGLFAADYFRTPKSSQEGVVGVDVDLVGEVVQEETSGRFRSRLSRWSSVLLLGAGVSVASVHLLDPQTEQSIQIEGTEAVYVIDQSYTMTRTKDMSNDESRSDAVIASILGSLENTPQDMKIGAILYGLEAEQVAPLTTDRAVLSGGLRFDGIDGNGDSTLEALERAQDSLASSENLTGETLYLSTDGTGSGTEQIAPKLVEIAESGTQVVVFVPGTENGSYKLTEYDQNPIASGINTTFIDGLQDVPGVTVVETDSASEIQQVIEQQIHKTTTSTEKKPFTGFLRAGIGMMVLGGLVLTERTWKRQ